MSATVATVAGDCIGCGHRTTIADIRTGDLFDPDQLARWQRCGRILCESCGALVSGRQVVAERARRDAVAAGQWALLSRAECAADSMELF